MEGRRPQAMTCSDACRAARSRSRRSDSPVRKGSTSRKAADVRASQFQALPDPAGFKEPMWSGNGDPPTVAESIERLVNVVDALELVTAETPEDEVVALVEAAAKMEYNRAAYGLIPAHKFEWDIPETPESIYANEWTEYQFDRMDCYGSGAAVRLARRVAIAMAGRDVSSQFWLGLGSHWHAYMFWRRTQRPDKGFRRLGAKLGSIDGQTFESILESYRSKLKVAVISKMLVSAAARAALRTAAPASAPPVQVGPKPEHKEKDAYYREKLEAGLLEPGPKLKVVPKDE
jgi:hypothetical protein